MSRELELAAQVIVEAMATCKMFGPPVKKSTSAYARLWHAVQAYNQEVEDGD